MEPKTEAITQTAETPTPPAPPDWRAEHKDDIAREYVPVSQYKGIQRELNKARQAAPKIDLTELEDRILERLAPALDSLRESDEEEPKRKPAPSEILKQQREARKPAPQPAMDPVDARKMAVCVDIMEELGIKPGSAEFEKLDKECPDVDDLLPVLKTRLKEAHAKDALEALKVEAAKKQKESGVTKGDGGPSAPGTASFTRKQIAEGGYAFYKAHKAEIDAAEREGRIT